MKSPFDPTFFACWACLVAVGLASSNTMPIGSSLSSQQCASKCIIALQTYTKCQGAKTAIKSCLCTDYFTNKVAECLACIEPSTKGEYEQRLSTALDICGLDQTQLTPRGHYDLDFGYDSNEDDEDDDIEDYGSRPKVHHHNGHHHHHYHQIHNNIKYNDPELDNMWFPSTTRYQKRAIPHPKPTSAPPTTPSSYIPL